MITKGILKTINYNENSCTVRIPLFETASSTNEVVLPAVFLTQPGTYNGYSEGDIVFIDFENNSLNNPIVLGKLYLGAVKEKESSKKGGLTIADLSVTSSASLPLDTKLVFNASDSTTVPVEGGFSTYKSLLDIIKSLYKTETSITKATEESLENITKIKVEYLSQLVSDPEPTKENPNWDIVMPNYQDGYEIWQKTTCYNSRGQILSIEIICFSSIAAVATYWLKCSTRIHNGSQQNERLEITSMIKLGSSPETVDEESVLTYNWSKGAIKDAKIMDPATPYRLVFENTPDSPIPNENLIIKAYRNGVLYEQETITFAPLNTPVLVLSNENASIEYDSYGFTKMNRNAFVESTASIKLNNKDVEVKKYNWTVTDCTADNTIGTSSATIKITDIAETADSATATCEAIYLDNLGNEVPLTKVFSISKVKQGRSLYKLDISNDFITIPAIDNGKGQIEIPDDFDWDYLTSHTVNAYYGDELIEFTCSTNNPAENISEKVFHLKYVLSSTLVLKNPIIEDEPVNKVTFTLADLLGKTGFITYELYRGKSKVATAKFEATRLDSGTPATSYWLNISSPIHTGSRQTDAITIQPKIETGNSGQDNDILAKIRCQYVGESSYIEVVRDSNTGKITLPTPLQDKNILIEASQKEDFSNIYESETITFSPLNTPVLDLSNDSAALTYTAGGLKINKEQDKEDTVKSTATLYLNGKEVTGVVYNWSLEDCKAKDRNETYISGKTVEISHLSAPKSTATCSVNYGGETFTKVFSIAKQIQGEASTSYWLKTSCVVHTGSNQEKKIEATAMKKVGESTEEPDDLAKLYYRYHSDTIWAGGDSALEITTYKNEDLYIVASHTENFSPDITLEQTDSDIYDWETITYSPMNTPVLDLTNDSAALAYNAENNKIEVEGEETTSVTSTATLYLNGEAVPNTLTSYSWTLEGCDGSISTDNKTVTVETIHEDTLVAKAICKATYKGKSYTKTFSITKQVIATTYWLKASHATHTGENQTQAIQVIAMKKEGTNSETLDNNAHLWYKFKGESSWTKAKAGSEYVLNIETYSDADLIIFAAHNSKDFTNEEITETSTEIYEWETITYSPLNTPVVDLDNDTASLVYDADDTKIGNNTVSSTATLYLNGKPITSTSEISYKWTADKCTFEGDDNKATIQVKEIVKGDTTATATCKITIGNNGIGENGQFAGKSYEKKFTISKQFKGDPTISYWIAPATKIIKINADNTISTDTVDFQIIKKSGTKTPEAISLTSGGPLKLKVGINGQSLTDFNEKATDNTYSIDTLGVSTSIIIALYDNDIEIDRETINVVKDGKSGEDGESTYKINIENDFISVPTDFEGNIHLDTDSLEELSRHVVTIYYGTQRCPINSYTPKGEVPNTGIGLSYEVSEGLSIGYTDTFTPEDYWQIGGYPDKIFNWITSLTTDTGTITYTAYIDGQPVASATVKVTKVKSGEPTTYYKLEVDCSTIVRKQDGTTVPEIIVAKGYKYTGSTKEEVNLRLEYRLDDSSTWNAGNLPVNLKTENVTKSLQLRMRFSDSQTFLDSETIPVVYDGVDGVGSDTIQVFNAFLWTTDYIMSLEDAGINSLPSPLNEAGRAEVETLISNRTNAVHESANTWQVVNPLLLPTKNAMNDARKDWKLVYISSITVTTPVVGEPSYSMWTEPEIYLCKDEDAYRILTTAEGLFDYGQGIYYTYEPGMLTTEDLDGKTAPTSITIKTGSTYTQGTRINNTQLEIAEWIAKGNNETEAPLNSVKNRKKVIKVYIDAEYIRAGALTVGDASNPLFQAGLDNDTVYIGGFTVNNNKLTAGNDISTITLQSISTVDEYTQVEFIQATGAQYIDTGIALDYNTDSFEITAEATKADQDGFIFGNYDTNSKGQAFLYHYQTANTICFYIEGDPDLPQQSLSTGLTSANLSKNTYKFVNKSLYLNNNNTPVATLDSNWQYTNKSEKTACIAAGWNPEGGISYYYYGKIYGCRIWQNGVLIRNFIPVFYKNNTYGLYDLISAKFYPSKSNTDFTGPSTTINEFTSIYTGSNNPASAPFSVTNTGKLKATSGEIGGFSLSATEFKTLRTEDNGYGITDNPDVLITTRGSSQWGKVANREGTDWRLLVGEHFGVNSDGYLYCDGANVSGNLIATSGRLEKISLIESDYLDSDQIESTDINTTNLAVTNEATIAGFTLKSVDTTSQQIKSKEVSLQITTPTGSGSYTSGIGTYIGGNWLFTLTFACFDGTTQQSFITQHNFTDYQIYYATFESNESKIVTEGSTVTTTNYLTKVYFNNASLTAFKGRSTITSTVSGGGGGASPASQWRLKEVGIRVKNGNSWELKGLSYFNTDKAARVTINYLDTTNDTNLLLDGSITVGGKLLPKSNSLFLGDETNKWNKLYVDEIVGTTKIEAPSIYATTFYASSDRRLKENIKEFIPHKSILDLPVVEFDFKKSKEHQIGCLAQDLQEICPEIVITNKEGYLNISENKLVYLLLVELKKLNSKVLKLEQLINTERKE